jgi:hypothetical protein
MVAAVIRAGAAPIFLAPLANGAGQFAGRVSWLRRRPPIPKY